MLQTKAAIYSCPYSYSFPYSLSRMDHIPRLPRFIIIVEMGRCENVSWVGIGAGVGAGAGAGGSQSKCLETLPWG